MSNLRTAAQQALEVLEFCTPKPRPTDDDYAEQGWKEHNAAITALRAALAQQAEPVAWVASKDGRVIYDDASTDDGLLRVSGDFENDEQRVRYAQRIVDKLNAAPPQRTMVPLTEEEINIIGITHQSLRQVVRAVEQASWEKNHG